MASPTSRSPRARHVALVLAAVTVLLLKHRLGDAMGGLPHDYLGNVAGSFATFFVVAIGAESRLDRARIAILALAVVELFELTDGFGVMTNVYDPFDYLANAVGVALAWYVDVVTSGGGNRSPAGGPP